MLTEKQIDENYEKFRQLLLTTTRPGVEDLVLFLDNSDFKTAPASAKYHNNFKGGLCAHSLNVYKNILKLAETFHPDAYENSINTLKIVSLLHDLAKIDFYEVYVQNKKDYNPAGKQSDSAGRFDWIQVEQYKVKDSMYRSYVCGEHGLNSYMLASKFMTITEEEAACIINHHMSLDNGKPRTDISEIMNRYPIATLLCNADMLAAYLDENPYKIDE